MLSVILVITIIVLLSTLLSIVLMQQQQQQNSLTSVLLPSAPQPATTAVEKLKTECHYQADVGYVCPLVAKRTDGIDIKPYQLCPPEVRKVAVQSLFNEWKTEMHVSTPEECETQLIGGIASGEILYIMYKDNTFIASAYIERKKFFPFISNLFVHPNHRKHGYARDMLAHCLHHIKMIGFTEARLWCSKDLVPFYNHLGWKEENIDGATHVMKRAT